MSDVKIPRYFTKEMIPVLTEDCDGAFLIVDTAKHVGIPASRNSVQNDLRHHVGDCEGCQNTILMEGIFSGF